MEYNQNLDTVVHVQPALEASDNEQDAMLDVCCGETSHSCKEEAEQPQDPLQISTPSASCARKVDCVAVPNTLVSQDITLLADDSKESISVARQKLCNVVRNLQKQHIAELFPIMDSRETTEGTDELFICRICHTRGEETLIAPCSCKGSTQFVHASCLLTWFKKSVKNHCELCQQHVPIKKKRKPIMVWKRAEDRPIPLIWFVVFFVGLCLNILSIQVNASESCKSTACLIFYVVNGFGIVLDAAFLWFWWMKCLIYLKKWCAINQDWFINDEKNLTMTMLPAPRGSKVSETVQSTNELTPAKQSKDPVVQV